MNSTDRLPHVLFVVGPTACGKSDMAVEIAEAFYENSRARSSSDLKPEIINTDSVAFFEAVQIGAAKPGPELLRRAKHHLIGHVPKHEKYTAGDFRTDALEVLAKRSPSVQTFIAAGGSGFYVQALEKGMYDVADPTTELKDVLARDEKELGMPALYEELKERDPETHARLNANDHYRILRALEILRGDSSGRTLGQIREAFEKSRPPAPFKASKLGIFRPRDILRQKVTLRTQLMLKHGFIDEVIALRKEGLSAWSPLQSVGYKEVQSYLDGLLPLAELEQAIVTSTMQLAKSQMTWFKRDPDIVWFETDTAWEKAKLHGLKKLEE